MGNHRRFQMSSDVIGFAPRNAASGCRAETGSEEGGNGEQQTGGEKHVAVQKRARLGEAGLQAAARSTHPDSLLLVSSQPPNCSSSRPSLPLPEPGQTFCDLPGVWTGLEAWSRGGEEREQSSVWRGAELFSQRPCSCSTLCRSPGFGRCPWATGWGALGCCFSICRLPYVYGILTPGNDFAFEVLQTFRVWDGRIAFAAL